MIPLDTLHSKSHNSVSRADKLDWAAIVKAAELETELFQECVDPDFEPF